MSKIDLKLNYKGAITSPENIKKDFRKAMKIVLLSFISAAALSVVLFLMLYYT